jgi:hypothetical protein
VNAQGVLLDFESKLRDFVCAANEPFLFYGGSGEENFTGIKAWSLVGFLHAIQRIDTTLIEFHNRKGDIEKWATLSLRDEELGRRLERIRASKFQGEELRRKLITAVQTRLNEFKKPFLQ